MSATPTKLFVQAADRSGRPIAGAYSNSDCVMARALSASTAESVTVPAGAKWCIIGAPVAVDFFINLTTTATVPGDTTDGSASVQNSRILNVDGVTTISVISTGTPVITFAFYLDGSRPTPISDLTS